MMMVIIRPRITDHHHHPLITLDNSELVNADKITVLGVMIDAKFTFEKHMRSVV